HTRRCGQAPAALWSGTCSLLLVGGSPLALALLPTGLALLLCAGVAHRVAEQRSLHRPLLVWSGGGGCAGGVGWRSGAPHRAIPPAMLRSGEGVVPSSPR